MTLPTIAQNAPYGWFILADSSGNYIASLPATETNSAAILSALGAVGDTAWSGTGNGSEIAILKKIVANQAGPYSVQFLTPQQTEQGYSEQAGLTAASNNALLVPSTDVSAYREWSLQVTGTWSATLTPQGSNDNTNWVACVSQIVSLSVTNFFSLTANGLYYGPIKFRYFRVLMSPYSSGTANGTLELYTLPAISQVTNAVQSGSYTVQPGNTQNTTPWLSAGPTLNASQPANTAANVVVKGTPGYLWSATVTATGTAQLDIYDNATTNSGLKLLSIPANAAVGSLYTFPGGARAVNGITSNGVANCPAVSIQYQ